MQKVRGSLRPVKAAYELEILTGQPLSICQKLLSGHRVENREMLVALMRTRLITDVVLAITEGATDPAVKAMRKAAKHIALDQEMARKRRQIEEDGE